MKRRLIPNLYQQLMPRSRYRFHEVAGTPEGPGVYAWYCRYELPERNIDDLIKSLQGVELEKQRDLVRAFLGRYLFSYFQEQPYDVVIKAPLRPYYEGSVEHISCISSSLVERFVNEPMRLKTLASLLRAATPEFASPIYIGSTKSLRQRLLKHVDLIRQYRESLLNLKPSEIEAITTSEQKADHSFAREAGLVRRFDPNDLWVYTFDIDLDPEYTFDIENILNRINFPLCGRN